LLDAARMKSLALSLLILAACTSNEGVSSASLTQEPGQCGEIETHVFGIYAAPGDAVTIHVERPGHHALVVSAHDATHWTITAGAGVTIDGVYAVGIREQTVTAPDGTKVRTDSRDTGGPEGCGYSYPYDGRGCNTDQLLNLTSIITKHGATSFHGCRSASTFRVAGDLGVTSNCDVPLDEYVSCLGPDSCGGPILL
jgi:hypothetical protein